MPPFHNPLILEPITYKEAVLDTISCTSKNIRQLQTQAIVYAPPKVTIFLGFSTVVQS